MPITRRRLMNGTHLSGRAMGMGMKYFGLFGYTIRLGLAASWVMTSAACSPSHKPASDDEIEFLASDAHVRVGETALVFPFVALGDYVSQKASFTLDRRGDRRRHVDRLNAFRIVAQNSRTAPSLDHLEVSLGTYGWNDSDMAFRRICARLKRRWSKSICDNPWAPLKQAMPVNPFYIADARHLGVFERQWTVGGERRSDQIRLMRLKPGEVSTVCDKVVRRHTRFCTAAKPLGKRIIVVWTVWEGPHTHESYRQMAEREGDAIAAFVDYAVASTEDFRQLHRVSCATRRPGSSIGPDGDDPCTDLPRNMR